MKKILAVILATLMMATLCTVFASADSYSTVYLKAGGTGDGTTEEKAVGTLPDAMEKAAAFSTDAKIQVVGEVNFDLTNYYTSPTHTNKIIITGKGTSGKLTVDTSNKNSAIWYLGGDTQFENIEIYATTNVFTFYTELNDLYFLEGVNVTSEARISIRAVGSSTENTFDGLAYNANCKIILLSGKFNDVAAFAQNGTKGDLKGDVTLVFGGTAVANNLTVCRNAYGCVTNATLYIDGGVIDRFVGYTDKSKANMDTKGMIIGATEKFTIVVTDNFDPTNSFTIPVNGVQSGFSGSSIYTADANAIVTSAYVGEYKINAEPAAAQKIGTTYYNADSFDAAISVIPTGTGLPANLIPEMSDANDGNGSAGNGNIGNNEGQGGAGNGDIGNNEGQGGNNNPETGDMTVAIVAVMILSVAAFCVTLKIRKSGNV